MMASAWRYSQNFGHLAFHSTGRKLLWWQLSKKIEPTYSTTDLAAKAAMTWLFRAQDVQNDSGFGTFYLKKGWTSSYPETSGYIIPILLLAARVYQWPEARNRALDCANWLLSIQHPNGGWAGGYVHQNRPPIVFNTAQVIRGLLAAYQETKHIKYLDAATRAGQWLCTIQNALGYWQNHVYLNQIRVYDTYVAAPLAALYLVTQNEVFKQAVERQCDWAIQQKQMPNAWFRDADNTVKNNHKPITHTLAYTLDGLIECGLLFNRNDWVEAGAQTAKKLAELALSHQGLMGRYNSKWEGSEAFLQTGAAQLCIAWQRLENPNQPIWLEARLKVMGQLRANQIPSWAGRNLAGGLFGSSPFWGRYEAFGIPNWGVKYYLEALLWPYATK